MALVRRVLVALSLVVAGLVAFAATTLAVDVRSLGSGSIRAAGGAGGGGLPAAGNYKNSNVFASFFSCCGADGSTQIQFNVNHTRFVSNPRVGPSTTTDEVDVQFSVSDFATGTSVSGCIIPDHASDFSVDQKLSSAALNTTVQATTRMCQGQSLNGVTPPIMLSATWTVSGPTRSSSGDGKYTCAGYQSETQTFTSGSSNANATFTASFLTGGPVAIAGANLFSFDQHIHAQGTPPSGCAPLGGKGAGPGPQAAGDYRSSSMSASMSVQPDDASQQPFSVFVTSFTNTAHPLGGPVSTLTETDLNLFQFNFFQFVRDCWVIPPGDFTMAGDLHTASLNAAVDGSTQACPFANNTGPSVFSITATWNATSPLASFSTAGQGGCGGFHTSGTSEQSAVSATATGSWPGTAASFTDANAFVSTTSSNIHIQGTFAGC